MNPEQSFVSCMIHWTCHHKVVHDAFVVVDHVECAALTLVLWPVEQQPLGPIEVHHVANASIDSNRSLQSFGQSRALTTHIVAGDGHTLIDAARAACCRSDSAFCCARIGALPCAHTLRCSIYTCTFSPNADEKNPLSISTTKERGYTRTMQAG